MRLKRSLGMIMACVMAGNLCLSSVASAGVDRQEKGSVSDRTDFITSDTDIDQLLKRDYVDNVPLGYSEDLFSLYQPGWGFDRADVYRTGIASGFGMPVTVTANQIPITVDQAEFTPSVVTSSYTPREDTGPKLVKTNISLNAKSIYHGAQAEGYPRVDASFSQEQWGRSLAQAYQGTQSGDAANWNTFRTPEDTAAVPVPEGGDWTTITFEKAEKVDEIRIHTFADANISYPEKITVYAWEQETWKEISVSEGKAEDGWYTIALPETVTASGFKLAFEVEAGKALGVDLIEYLQYSYDESGLETYEINHAAGAGRNGDPLADTSFSQEKWGACLEYIFDRDTASSANQGWNTYREADDQVNSPIPQEGDWITVTFAEAKEVDALALYVYSDGGNTLPPEAVRLLYRSGEDWTEVEYQQKPQTYVSGKNLLTFDTVSAEEFKIVFTAQSGKCVSLNELELIQTILSKPQKISIEGYKYISPDNMLVSILEAENQGEESSVVEVSAGIPATFEVEEQRASGTLVNLEAQMQGDSGFQQSGTRLTKQITLAPGEKGTFRVVMALSETREENQEKISKFLSDEKPVETQRSGFSQWFTENIPYLDVPDETLKQIYYFRWYTYRNHIRKTTDDYYIISEFLPNVSWAGKHNSINCPAGLHVAEGRWLRNSEYLDDYLSHWLDKGGSVRSYSFWIADAYYNRYLATGDDYIFDYVDKLKANFEAWSDHYNEDLGLYWQFNDRDGMENSISSAFGYRPTINSYMYGDAVAISKLCALTGDQEGATLYAQKAADIKEHFDAKTWDGEDDFYKVIACAEGGTLTNGEQLQSVKEEIGYIPWMFHLPDDDQEHAAAWKYVMDENHFLAPYGLRTAEKAYARITPDGEYGTGICRWDGPVWPFATSQTLTAMANLLHDYHQDVVTNEDYFYLLQNYAQAQYKNGAPWIAENLDGDTGRWIADERRSPNYNHSSFNDLVISGLFGIRPSEGEILNVNPLIPEGEWDHFCLENVPYHGKNITILYDKNGEVYGAGSGFQVYVDGRRVYVSQNPEPVEISLEAALDRIEVTPPVKTEYQVGEAFEEEGLEVVAYYTDESFRTLEQGQYQISGFDSAKAGAQIITVSYTEGDITAIDEFTVIIREPAPEPAPVLLEHLEVTKPAKTEYQVGEVFDSTGLQVTACYSDGSKKRLNSGEYRVDGFRSNTAGTFTITISYTEKGVKKEAFFAITVKEAVNKTAAQSYYDSIAKWTNTKYTKESWETFVKARDVLKGMLGQLNASQTQMDQALEACKKAQAGLKEAVRRGQIFRQKGLKYKVTKISGTKGTVLVTGAVKKKIKNVVIPKTVTIKGVTCRVIGIGKYAFKNCKRLTKVVIGANVETIGRGAFAQAGKLKSIQIKSRKLRTVGKHALKGIHKKALIRVPKQKKKEYTKKLRKKGQSNTVNIR